MTRLSAIVHVAWPAAFQTYIQARNSIRSLLQPCSALRCWSIPSSIGVRCCHVIAFLRGSLSALALAPPTVCERCQPMPSRDVVMMVCVCVAVLLLRAQAFDFLSLDIIPW